MPEILIGERRKNGDKDWGLKNPNLWSLYRDEDVVTGGFRDETVLFLFLGTMGVYSVCLH